MADEMIDWLRAIVDDEERIALEASRDGHAYSPTGEHWRWECSNCDTPIEISDVVVMDEFLCCPACGSSGVDVRSVEQYPSSYGTLAHLVTHQSEEMRPVDALHIVRHDPARVLREVQVKRRIIEVAISQLAVVEILPPEHAPAAKARAVGILQLMAEVYRDRPGWRDEWAVDR